MYDTWTDDNRRAVAVSAAGQALRDPRRAVESAKFNYGHDLDITVELVGDGAVITVEGYVYRVDRCGARSPVGGFCQYPAHEKFAHSWEYK